MSNNYAGSKIKIITSCDDYSFEDKVNLFLREAIEKDYVVWDIQYQHSMATYRDTTYTAMIIYSEK